MSPEVEAQKVIAISLGKIASSRVQRGGPKLCKNLLVANLIHKARTFVDDQFHCYYPSYEQIPPASQSSDSTTSDAPVIDKSDPEFTEVACEDDEMSSGSSLPEDYPSQELECFVSGPVTEYDDKENDSPEIPLDSPSEISRVQTSSRTRVDSSLIPKPRACPSRCLKRRNSCSERKADYETHRSPSKRVRDQKPTRIISTSELVDLQQDSCDSDSELPVDGMDVEQITTLVSAFSNSFREFSSDCESTEKSQNGFLWRSSSVPDMVLCAQQASNVLKMRQQVFETSTAVLA